MMERKGEQDGPLAGMRILLAEDEFLIAILLEEIFREAGAEILSAATLVAALKMAEAEPLSVAVLDVRLGRQTTETVADVLAARAVPFIFYTGQALPERMHDRFPDAKVLTKPARQHVFVKALLEVAGN